MNKVKRNGANMGGTSPKITEALQMKFVDDIWKTKNMGQRGRKLLDSIRVRSLKKEGDNPCNSGGRLLLFEEQMARIIL